MNFSGFDNNGGTAQTDDPIKLFDEAPKPPGINDLYKSQADVLSAWYNGKSRDTVVKLHTGGGKTLVGLLMAKSMLVSSGRPVLYLCPDKQLADQTLRKAVLYSIPAVAWRDRGFPAEFENAEAVMVATYDAFFNGETRFGTADGRKRVVDLGGLIVDDAHVGFTELREAFTYTVSSRSDNELYRQLANLFRDDFEAIGKLGTFDDVVARVTQTVLEVPSWAWKAKEIRIRDLISAKQPKDENGKVVDWERFLKWPFLRDQLAASHALISHRGFSITPVLPIVDDVPSFVDCPRRVFMSATVHDDTALVRTFGLRDSYLTASTSGATGIAERFIVAPAFTPNFEASYESVTKVLANHVAQNRDRGVVVLAPSAASAKPWDGVARVVKGNQDVISAIDELKDGTTRGPIVFLNRYDGLDLPENACRLLILWEVPAGAPTTINIAPRCFTVAKSLPHLRHELLNRVWVEVRAAPAISA